MSSGRGALCNPRQQPDGTFGLVTFDYTGESRTRHFGIKLRKHERGVVERAARRSAHREHAEPARRLQPGFESEPSICSRSGARRVLTWTYFGLSLRVRTLICGFIGRSAKFAH